MSPTDRLMNAGLGLMFALCFGVTAYSYLVSQ